jgi:hypothetical protein
MEKINSLNLSLDRVFIQLIVPGIISIFPYCIFIHTVFPKEINYLLENTSVCVTGVFIVSLVIGMILENIGSAIEVNIYDKKNSKNNTKYYEIWEKYLLLKFDGGEPVGLRYIRNVLLRMKFELSFGLSLLPATFGLFILNSRINFIDSIFYQVIFFLITPMILSFYILFYEGYNSSLILANTRKLLVEKYSGNESEVNKNKYGQ